jgi:hypothetical protein
LAQVITIMRRRSERNNLVVSHKVKVILNVQMLKSVHFVSAP